MLVDHTRHALRFCQSTNPEVPCYITSWSSLYTGAVRYCLRVRVAFCSCMWSCWPIHNPLLPRASCQVKPILKKTHEAAKSSEAPTWEDQHPNPFSPIFSLFGWCWYDRIRSWIITAGWFGVREKYYSGWKFTIVYDQTNMLLILHYPFPLVI